MTIEMTRINKHKAVRETGLNGLLNNLDKAKDSVADVTGKVVSNTGKTLGVTALGVTIVGTAAMSAQAAEIQPHTVNATTSPAVYTVKAGDTFYNIATTHGMKPEQLKAINPDIKNVSMLRVNEKINLRKANVKVDTSQIAVKQEANKTNSPKSQTYTVKSNDTMYNIAKTHGITVKYLGLLNPDVKGNLIKPGDVLRVGGVPSTIKATEKPQQEVVQTEQIKEVEFEVIGLGDENHLYGYVDGDDWVFYAGGKEEIQKDIARYKKGDHLNIKYFQNEYHQFQIKSIAYRGNGQTDLSVDFDSTFLSIDSNSKKVVVKNNNGNVVSYKISDYLASRNLHFNAGSNVRLVGEKTTNGEIVIENIDK